MSENKQDLNVWQLAARVARMDAEIRALWKLVCQIQGRPVPVRDERQKELFEEPVVDGGSNLSGLNGPLKK